jgi:hypothetical protein
VLTSFELNPLAYIADNASNCVLANDLLADWSNAASGYQDDEDEDEDVRSEQENPDEEIDVNGEPLFIDEVRAAFKLPAEAIGCHAHLINLIINDALNPIEVDIKAMQRFVHKFRKNSTTRDFIISFAGELRPYFRNTVVTRWKYAYAIPFILFIYSLSSFVLC